MQEITFRSKTGRQVVTFDYTSQAAIYKRKNERKFSDSQLEFLTDKEFKDLIDSIWTNPKWSRTDVR